MTIPETPTREAANELLNQRDDEGWFDFPAESRERRHYCAAMMAFNRGDYAEVFALIS